MKQLTHDEQVEAILEGLDTCNRAMKVSIAALYVPDTFTAMRCGFWAGLRTAGFDDAAIEEAIDAMTPEQMPKI